MSNGNTIKLSGCGDAVRKLNPELFPGYSYAKRDGLQPSNDTGSRVPATVVEPSPGNGRVGKDKVQKRDDRKFLVIVTAFRRRWLDDDNPCEKYLVDLCRYSGIVPDDARKGTRIKTRQEIVGKGEREYVKIEVFCAGQADT